MRLTKLNTVLKGTSTATFNESPHHPSAVISIITWAAHAASASFTFSVKLSAPDDRELSVFSGQRKPVFFLLSFSCEEPQSAFLCKHASSFSEQHMAISQDLPVLKLSRQQELHNRFTHCFPLCFISVYIQKAVHTGGLVHI